MTTVCRLKPAILKPLKITVLATAFAGAPSAG